MSHDQERLSEAERAFLFNQLLSQLDLIRMKAAPHCDRNDPDDRDILDCLDMAKIALLRRALELGNITSPMASGQRH